ncbi:MAG: GYD domain-containing protein [Maritimibacter sp.]|nr:GYD domain-containing protein [Maritimibacter sp.]
MPRFIFTANYSVDAIKGMLAKPSDRAAATRALVEAAGGKLVDYYATTGPKDFLMIVDTDDVTDLLAGIMAAGATGVMSNAETIRAFSSDELTSIQKKAQKLAAAYHAPGH